MSAPRFVLEVRDSHGALVTRARIDALPVTVGRGYGCDVIVDDPYLDPVHVRIIQEGDALVAEDAGSANGLRANGSNERVPRVPLVRGTILHAGRTTIRYVDPAEPVPPARRDRPAAWHSPLAERSRLASPWVRAGAVAACLAISALVKWSSTFGLRPMREVGSEVVAALVALAIWAGLWSVGARLARHPALFTYHLAITSLATAALVVVFGIDGWLEFLWPRQWFIAALLLTLVCGTIVGLVYAQLGLASSLRRWWRIGAAVALPAVLFGVIYIVESSDESKFSSKMTYDAELKPVPARFVPAQSVEDLAEVVSELRQSVDKDTASKD